MGREKFEGGVNQSAISRGLRREGEAPAEPKIPAPGCNLRHGSAGASPSRISLTLPKPYLGILVLGPDSDKPHFGSHPFEGGKWPKWSEYDKVISVKEHTSLLVLLPSFCVAMMVT